MVNDVVKIPTPIIDYYLHENRKILEVHIARKHNLVYLETYRQLKTQEFCDAQGIHGFDA